MSSPPLPPQLYFCLTTTASDPVYLFIYLFNYLLIPSLVWPFNDQPGGMRDGAFTSGTDDRSLHLLRGNKSKCYFLWTFIVCAKEFCSQIWHLSYVKRFMLNPVLWFQLLQQ